MTKEKTNRISQFLSDHQPKKWKIRTKLLLIIVVMALISTWLFRYMWDSQLRVCEGLERLHLISWFDEEAYIANIREDAVHYNVPEESDKAGQKAIAPFLKKYSNKYLGIYIYNEDGQFCTSRYAQVVDDFISGSLITDSFDIMGEYTNEIQVTFANGTYQVVYSSYSRCRFVYPYVIFSAFLCIVVFFSGVLFYVRSVIKRIDGIKNAIVNMSQGDLEHEIPMCGGDEVGIVAKELDVLRQTLDENIKREEEIRQTNQDLISAISHDLRTPLTVLNGYLEVLQLNRINEEQRELYIHKCLQKAEDIKALTDHMFEYAFAYETNEQADLQKIEIAQIAEILQENCEFVELAGFTVEKDFADVQGYMYADEMMLKRMTSNLFSNILKYADKGKSVYVRSKIEQGMLGILIVNTIKLDVGQVESNHIGLRSSERMVALHHGQMHVQHDKQEYRVHIFLPILSYDA